MPRASIQQEISLLPVPWIGQYVSSQALAYPPLSSNKLSVLWRTYGQCENYGILSGHKGAIMDLHWSRDSRVIFSASADMMLASWDVDTGTRMRRHPGHEEVINTMDLSKRGEEVLVSGSDDGYIGVNTNKLRKIWTITDLYSYGIHVKRQP